MTRWVKGYLIVIGKALARLKVARLLIGQALVGQRFVGLGASALSAHPCRLVERALILTLTAEGIQLCCSHTDAW